MFLHRQEGFSMIELILTLVLFSILALLMVVLLRLGVTTTERVSSHEERQNHVRFGISRMNQEIIMLKTADITAVAGDRLDFKDTGGNSTNFRIGASGPAGTLKILRGSDILIPDASALSFTYYDQNGNSTLSIPSIRRIRWDITVLGNPSGTITFRSMAYLRGTHYANFH